ncbi:MAG: TonB-dependent receptor [Archangiaceae bacterium]|nr:TonB-dependent receptor [Archangiaceae bacterium]
MRAVGLALLCFALNALAQDGGTGVLTKAPTLVRQVEATVPPELLDAGTGGTVVMEIDIGPDGAVMDARVVQSAGAGFDREALAAIRQFGFTPAEVDGQPAAVRIQFSYEFFFKQQVVEVPVVADAGVTGLVNFAGIVRERGTRDPLANAQVVIGEGEAALETLSDKDGRFEVKDAPSGTQRVVVLLPGYTKFETTETFAPGQRTDVTYFVRKQVYGGYETIVRAPRERKEVAQVTLKQEEIRLIPGTNGDAFRVVQNLPGVARSPFGLGFLVIRGSKAWDTRTFVDEAPVPLLFHFGGLFSTYNSNLLDSLTFQQGNYGAEYGRGTAGLVSATARTPSKKGIHGYFDVNVADISGLIELPITDAWSVAVSARRSYIDAFLPAVLSLIPGATDAIGFTVAPRYWDYQARLEWKPPKGKSRFFVSFFGSNDQLVAALPNPAIDPEGRATFGTTIAYNRLVFGFDTKLHERVDFRTRTTFGLDNVGFTAGSDIFANTRLFPFISRNTFTIAVPEAKLTVATGLDFQMLPYTLEIQAPPPPQVGQIPDPFASRRLVADRTSVFQVEPALFAEAIWKPVEPLKLVAGIRGDYNSVMNKAWADPRLSVLWQAHERVLVKGGVGIYHQPPDYRQGLLSKKFGNPDLMPEGARQAMVGGEFRFTDAISLDVQLYYKDLFDQARATLATNGGDTSMGANPLRYESFGRGRSYGAEILLRHALTKNFFGWVSYTLSRSERDFRGGTVWARGQYDQPHNLIVVASYKLPFDFIIGGRLRYTSGPLNTPIVGSIYDVNGNYYFPIQGDQFSERLPDFFQLDVRIDKRFVFQSWMLAIYVDVQNVTNRANVEGVLNSYDYSTRTFVTGLPILPVLGVRGEY